jgi:hypothetical protein
MTAIHIGWVMHHEPFGFDAWNMAKDTHAEPFTVGRFFQYWGQQFTESNPRVGQPLTYLAYKLEFVAIILTPLAYLVLAWTAFVLGTGRRLRWDRGRDLALYAIALGFMWFALPQIGKTMFCRAYGANYLYGAAIQLAFLVPLRLTPTARASIGTCVLYGLAGVIAGACNEHTGPTLCAFLLGYAIWKQRREAQRPTLAWAGAIGSIVGFAAIFFAPGQASRYDNLAQKSSLFGRLLSRGLTGNLDLYRDFLLAAAPLFALIMVVAIVGTARQSTEEQKAGRVQALRVIVIALVAGSMIAVTIFVSPKLGPRFYLVSCMLLLAGLLALVDAVVATPRGFVPLVALAAAASIYAAAHTIPLYGRLANQSASRLAMLQASTPGQPLTVEAFEQLDDSWWYLGDDFRAQNKRDMVATYFGLSSVVWRSYDSATPLGVSDVRFVASEPGILLDGFRGLDLKTIVDAIPQAVTRKPTHGDRIDFAVEFVGARPPLPRPLVLVGRWRPTGVEGWSAQIQRKGRATDRTVHLPDKTPMPNDFDLFILRVGDAAKPIGTSAQQDLHYTPWRAGAYWVLACHPTECFVIAAARQGG